MADVELRMDGSVAVVAYARPRRHNAFTDAMDDAFFGIVRDLCERTDVRAMVWRGEGPSFSSGRDTAELGSRPEGVSDHDYIAAGHARTRLLLDAPFPIVVALKGWVLGGSFERALLCDIRVAADDARMALPEVAHGVIPDSAGVARLVQMAGHGLASDLALTGRVMDAEEALRHGVVSRVVPPEDLDDTVLALAHEIASRSPTAVRFARDTIRAIANPLVERTLDVERLAQTVVFGSADYAELKRARTDGREPRFGGQETP